MPFTPPQYFVSVGTPASLDGFNTIAGVAAGLTYAALFPPANGGASPGAELVTTGILEIGIVLREAIAVDLGLSYVNITAPGAGTADWTVSGTVENFIGGSPNSVLVTHWSDGGPVQTTPVGSSMLRQVMLPAAIGASVQWTWPDYAPLIIPGFGGVATTPTLQTLGIGVFNMNAAADGPAIDIYMRWAEFSNEAVVTNTNVLARRANFL